MFRVYVRDRTLKNMPESALKKVQSNAENTGTKESIERKLSPMHGIGENPGAEWDSMNHKKMKRSKETVMTMWRKKVGKVYFIES